MNSPYVSRRGFTLMELIVSSVIFAVLAGALYSVFSGAIHMRERTYTAIERELPAAGALDLLRRDLVGMTTPGGTLTGAILGMADVTSGSNGGSLEFCTTSGIIEDATDEPWGDIQKVAYSLQDAPEDAAVPGKELVRDMTRNLLAPTTPEPERQRLLAGVATLKIDYLDEQAWVDAWDSAANANAKPAAVRVRVEFVAPNADEPTRRPLELVCDTNTTQTAATQP